jgi:hypothetical protein
MQLKDFIKELNNLSDTDLLVIMHECADSLGLVDINEATDILMLAKRTIYDKLKNNHGCKFVIGKHVFPLVNVILKQNQNNYEKNST